MKSTTMSGKEFVEHAKAHQGIFLRGNIAYDPERPDIILFGPPLPFGPCPAQPLPRDKVTILRLGSTHPCGDNKQAWDADILLASPDPANHEAVMLANLLASLSHAHSLEAKLGCRCSQAKPGPITHQGSADRTHAFYTIWAQCHGNRFYYGTETAEAVNAALARCNQTYGDCCARMQ